MFDHKWTLLSSETYIIDTGGVYGTGIGNGVCGRVQLWLVSRLFVIPLLWQLQSECSEMGIITGVLPFIATTNTLVDDCIGNPNGVYD